MAVRPASPFDKYLRNYEETHKCCGWNNAIDYCDPKALSALMEEVIDQKATEKAIKYTGGLSGDTSASYEYSYSDSEYLVSEDSSSMYPSFDGSMRDQQPLQFCTEDYDGDEACICETIENFENDAGRGFLNLKDFNCVHDTTLCYYSQSIECETADEKYEPWRQTSNNRTVTIDEVCGDNTCFVNGCGDMFSDDFWQYGAPRYRLQ